MYYLQKLFVNPNPFGYYLYDFDVWEVLDTEDGIVEVYNIEQIEEMIQLGIEFDNLEENNEVNVWGMRHCDELNPLIGQLVISDLAGSLLTHLRHANGVDFKLDFRVVRNQVASMLLLDEDILQIDTDLPITYNFSYEVIWAKKTGNYLLLQVHSYNDRIAFTEYKSHDINAVFFLIYDIDTRDVKIYYQDSWFQNCKVRVRQGYRSNRKDLIPTIDVYTDRGNVVPEGSLLCLSFGEKLFINTKDMSIMRVEDVLDVENKRIFNYYFIDGNPMLRISDVSVFAIFKHRCNTCMVLNSSKLKLVKDTIFFKNGKSKRVEIQDRVLCYGGGKVDTSSSYYFKAVIDYIVRIGNIWLLDIICFVINSSATVEYQLVIDEISCEIISYRYRHVSLESDWTYANDKGVFVRIALMGYERINNGILRLTDGL